MRLTRFQPAHCIEWTRLACCLPLYLKAECQYVMSASFHCNQTRAQRGVMNLTKHLMVAGVTALLAHAATAQTNPVDAASQPKRDGKVIVPERATANDTANANTTTANLRPSRPERPNLPPEVQALVEKFKRDARAYRDREEALKKQIEGANDKDRAVIREQLRELRAQWLERTKEMRKEYKDRQAELADKLGGHTRLLDATRNSAVQPTTDGGPRRGDD